MYLDSLLELVLLQVFTQESNRASQRGIIMEGAGEKTIFLEG